MFPAPPPIMKRGDRMRCGKVRTSRDASKRSGAERISESRYGISESKRQGDGSKRNA